MDKLKKYIDQIRGVSYKPDNIHNSLNENSVILLRANNIENNKINLDDVIYVDKSQVKDNQYLRKGDILVCASSGSRNLVGKAALVNEDIVATFGAFCKVVRPKSGIPKYWGYYFASDYYRTRISNVSLGANINNIRNEHIDNLEINYQSEKIQEKIVRDLSVLDEILSMKEEQISCLENMVKSRFVEMFGDPVTNSHEWETMKLSELGELNRGVSKHRPRNAPELLNGPYPLVQTGDIANADTYIIDYSSTYSELGLKQSRMWSKGTLCITIAANIAKTGILTFDACFPDSVVGFVAGDRTNQLYMHHWFSFFQKILEEQAPQSAQKNINLAILSNLSVMLPPIELQNQFAEFIQQADKSKLSIQQSIETLQTLKAKLMQDYFG